MGVDTAATRPARDAGLGEVNGVRGHARAIRPLRHLPLCHLLPAAYYAWA